MNTLRVRFYNKLLHRLDEFIHQLNGIHDLTVHQQISQAYYMERHVELRELLRQYEHIDERLHFLFQCLEATGRTSFDHWRRDVRSLHAYQKKKTHDLT